MSEHAAQGTLYRINVSDGGVPKLPVASSAVTVTGLAEDRQAHPQFHGGPDRAVCLLGLDAIERLRAEGHPIEAGSTGENLTIAGLAWATVVPGTRLRFEQDVLLEVVSYAVPCNQIRASFRDGHVARMHADQHAAESRVYARVLKPGSLRAGETVELVPPSQPTHGTET